MTFTMSTEGDSVNSALSEASDRNGPENHTDSSRESTDAKEVPQEKTVENNVSAEKDQEKPKEESAPENSEEESETSEKKDEKPTENSEPKVENKSEEEKPEQKENDVDADKKEEKEEDSEVEEKEEKKKDDKEPKNSKQTKDKKKKKEPVSEKEEDEEEDEVSDIEEDEEDSEPGNKKGKKKGVPLLDQPLETSGKRERKNVQRFEEKFEKSDAKVEFEEGRGTPLGEIARVEASITRFKNDDLKVLHKLLFKVPAKSTIVKKNIKKFNGFPFEKDSEDYKKRVELCHKIDMKNLKSICEMLDLVKTGAKDDVVTRILDFLLEPKDSGKPIGGGRPKRASAVRANNRGYSSHDDYSSDERHASRARRDKGRRANLKEDSSSDEEFRPGDGSDGSDEKPRTVSKRKRGAAKKGSSEEDEISLSGASSDDSDAEPKTKRRKSVGKANSKAAPKKGGRGRGRPAKSAGPTPRKPTRGKKSKESSEDEEENEKVDDGSSSEDEPLAKKVKSTEPPTDDEIKTFIKDVLDKANLEEITMKTVCQRVYDNYPDFDLTARKNFIKSTVKDLIST